MYHICNSIACLNYLSGAFKTSFVHSQVLPLLTIISIALFSISLSKGLLAIKLGQLLFSNSNLPTFNFWSIPLFYAIILFDWLIFFFTTMVVWNNFQLSLPIMFLVFEITCAIYFFDILPLRQTFTLHNRKFDKSYSLGSRVISFQIDLFFRS